MVFMGVKSKLQTHITERCREDGWSRVCLVLLYQLLTALVHATTFPHLCNLTNLQTNGICLKDKKEGNMHICVIFILYCT